jgi:hypothetical protein
MELLMADNRLRSFAEYTGGAFFLDLKQSFLYLPAVYPSC